jgi:hypothetical protein
MNLLKKGRNSVQHTDESSDLEEMKEKFPAPDKRQEDSIDWTLPKLNAEAIHSRLKSHERFEVKSGYVMSGLPKFYDITGYCPSGVDEVQLWEKEVTRLVKVANSSIAIHLQGQEDWFGSADREGYNKLHKIAVQLQDALDICIHDNELLFIEHMPSQVDRENYHGAHDRLMRDYDPQKAQERFQRHLRLEHNNDKYYHALINYINAVMLQILLRTMRGALWEEQCVIAIAKFAAKLKVLNNNLQASAITSLAKTEEVRFRTKHKSQTQATSKYNSIFDNDERYMDVNTKMNQNQHRAVDIQFESGRIDAEMRYFIVMKTFHLGISRLLVSALSNLSSNEHTEMSTDVFNTSVLMYEDHITNRRLFLCCQRDGTIGAAADSMVIKSAGAAFKTCLDTWKSLIPPPDKVESEKERTSNADHASDDWTMLWWKWTELDQKTFEPEPNHFTASIKLSTMKSTISAFVPYSMVCGSFPSLLQDLSNKVFLICDPTEPIKPVNQTPFLAVFTVRTSAYMAKRFYLSNDDDACHISHSVLAGGEDLARSMTTGLPVMYADKDRAETDGSLRIRREAERKRMIKSMKEFRTWMIDEKSIIISSKIYAWGFLATCTILVLGGLAIGLSVGNRIRGVDPLGLASFCWVLSGFILVVAKSLRVENWPWSRFFRGQVVCCSVSEVCSVTGMNAQTILAILLKLEPRMNLIKERAIQRCVYQARSGGFRY